MLGPPGASSAGFLRTWPNHNIMLSQSDSEGAGSADDEEQRALEQDLRKGIHYGERRVETPQFNSRVETPFSPVVR